MTNASESPAAAPKSYAKQPASNKVIVVLMIAIGLWGAYHAVGAGLTVLQKQKFFGVSTWWTAPASPSQRAAEPTNTKEGEANYLKEKADLRRSIVVVVSTFSFLTFWGLMLYSRQRRLQKQSHSPN